MLVPAKCPECGGNINIDGSKKAAICEFCKQPFVVQDAINNFNTTYNITNNNEIKADVVNVYESKNSDFVIEGGILKNYQGESLNVTVPPTVKVIGRFAFKNMMVENVELPDCVVKIEDGAFFGCESLKSIRIPDSVAELTVLHYDKMMFSCFQPYGGETHSAIAKKDNDIGKGIFEGCKQLKWVVLSNRIKEIPEDMFSGCISLQKIVIPHSVVSIGARAFFDCSCLEGIIWNNNVKTIGERAFSNCCKLKAVSLPQTVISIGDECFKCCTDLDDLSLNEGLEEIGYYAFRSCEKIAKLVLPKTLKTICPGALTDLSVTNLNVPAGVSCFGKEWSDNGYFVGAVGVLPRVLNNVVLENGRKDISELMFYETHIKKINIPESVKIIRKSAFAYCSMLESIDVSNVEMCEQKAFLRCVNLKKVILNKTWEFSIVKRAFEDTLFFQDYCKTCSICPKCGEHLSLFGKCKTVSGYPPTKCKNYGIKVFSK